MGAHPFSTGADQCLVHNGSLSNHNACAASCAATAWRFETENDTEVAAAYLTDRCAGREPGRGARTHALDDLDGFYTFVVGTPTASACCATPSPASPP
jgi:methylamine---glutamate N-methyltransferase subunit A